MLTILQHIIMLSRVFKDKKMTPEQFLKSISIFNVVSEDYMNKHNMSLRSFSNFLGENVSDICKWRAGKKNLTVRVIVKLCRLFDFRPHELNPDYFPPDLMFLFSEPESKETHKIVNKKIKERKSK